MTLLAGGSKKKDANLNQAIENEEQRGFQKAFNNIRDFVSMVSNGQDSSSSFGGAGEPEGGGSPSGFSTPDQYAPNVNNPYAAQPLEAGNMFRSDDIADRAYPEKKHPHSYINLQRRPTDLASYGYDPDNPDAQYRLSKADRNKKIALGLVGLADVVSRYSSTQKQMESVANGGTAGPARQPNNYISDKMDKIDADAAQNFQRARAMAQRAAIENQMLDNKEMMYSLDLENQKAAAQADRDYQDDLRLRELAEDDIKYQRGLDKTAAQQAHEIELAKLRGAESRRNINLKNSYQSSGEKEAKQYLDIMNRGIDEAMNKDLSQAEDEFEKKEIVEKYQKIKRDTNDSQQSVAAKNYYNGGKKAIDQDDRLMDDISEFRDNRSKQNQEKAIVAFMTLRNASRESAMDFLGIQPSQPSNQNSGQSSPTQQPQGGTEEQRNNQTVIENIDRSLESNANRVISSMFSKNADDVKELKGLDPSEKVLKLRELVSSLTPSQVKAQQIEILKSKGQYRLTSGVPSKEHLLDLLDLELANERSQRVNGTYVKPKPKSRSRAEF